MRKIQILLLLLIMVGGLCGYIEYHDTTNDKIIYEDNLNYKDLSTEGSNPGYASSNVTVQLHLDYENKSERLNVNKDASLKEIKQAKAERLSRMKEYYYNKNIDMSSNIEMNGKEDMYISKYSPYIEYEYTYENFKALEKTIVNTINDCEYVDEAYIGFTEKKYEDEMTSTLMNSNGFEYYNNSIFTGDGVTIGLLETGIMDVDHPNFANTDCEYFNNFWRVEQVTEHAILTSNLIGGSKGICPDARIISAEVNGTYTNEIEWFLDNNTDIINMSFTRLGTYGTRDSQTEYLDYIVNNYDITIVAAAGNNESENFKVSNPGCGYNIITVGALDFNCLITDYSSFIMNSGELTKPTIVAQGEHLTIAQEYYSNSGTSFSCAAVTGMLGMLFEAYPYCSTSAALASLFLATTADMTGDGTRFEDPGFDNEIGAGLVDIHDAIMISGYEIAIPIQDVVAGQVIYETNITIPANFNFRVGVSRYCGNPNSQTSTLMTDLSLQMIDRFNIRVAHAYGPKEPILVIERQYDYDKVVNIQIVANSDQLFPETIYFVTNLNLA